eukprot:g1356.t1
MRHKQFNVSHTPISGKNLKVSRKSASSEAARTKKTDKKKSDPLKVMNKDEESAPTTEQKKAGENEKKMKENMTGGEHVEQSIEARSKDSSSTSNAESKKRSSNAGKRQSPLKKQKRSIASFFLPKSSKPSSAKVEKKSTKPKKKVEKKGDDSTHIEEPETEVTMKKTKKSRKIIVDSSDEEDEAETEMHSEATESKDKEETTPSPPKLEEKADALEETPLPPSNPVSDTTTTTTTAESPGASTATDKPSSATSGSKFASIFMKRTSKKSAAKKRKAPSAVASSKSKTDSPRTFFSKAIGDVPLRKEDAKRKKLNEVPAVKSKLQNISRSREYSLWKEGSPVPYAVLASIFDRIEGTTKRLEIQKYLTDLFFDVIQHTPEDLIPTVYLASNRLAPQFEGIELGIGDSLLTKAIVLSTGRSAAKVKADYEKKGDLGIVAEASRSSQRTLFKPKPLNVRGVYNTFRQIAAISGNRSQDKKIKLIQRLLSACQSKEARFIMRGLQGKLRIGLAGQTVNVSLATALAQHLHYQSAADAKGGPSDATVESAVNTLKSVMSECPSYDLIVPAALKYGWRELPKKCFLTAGTPVLPMLAKPTKGSGEIFERFSGKSFTCEYKYDGERAQIHLLPDGSTKVFSRNMEDNTNKYPDVAGMLSSVLKTDEDGNPVTSVIIDSEVVAYDVKNDRLLPFQTLSKRKRKTTEGEEIEIKVIVLAFDLLLVNGKSLLKKSFRERRKALHSCLCEKAGVLKFAQSYDVDLRSKGESEKSADGDADDDMEEVNRFLHKAVEEGTEGLMVKTLDENASYEPSVRSLNWLKLKKDYIDGCGDTLDLVPIAAWKGKGKRTGVYGAYLLACYDDEEDQFQAICKLGTGFSDEQLKLFTKQFQEHIIPKPHLSYCLNKEKMTPDVWFNTAAVWEIKGADLSISPVYTAGLGIVHESKGISLRFPRLMRVRDDKTPDDATTSAQVADMYNDQSLVHN